jgi:hypothetical protein
MRKKLPRFESSIFDWQSWRIGSPVEMFGIPCRQTTVLLYGEIFQKHAIGFCPAERTPCRPKLDAMAIMFYVKDTEFWFHMRRDEFDILFECEDPRPPSNG